MKKILCLILALLTILFAAVSCGSTDDNGAVSSDATLTDAPTTEEETAAPVVYKEYELKQFYIVYESLYNLSVAKEFRQKLNDATGIALPIVKAPATPYDCEIIVGETNRDVSKLCFDYKEGKYLTSKGIVCDNGKLQLLGIDKNTIDASADYFLNNVVQKGTGIISVPEVGMLIEEVPCESVGVPEKTGENTIRFVSNNILQQAINNSPVRITDLLGAFSYYDADIYALQEVDAAWNNTHKLEKRMEALGYALAPNELQTDIYYKVDRFELVDGGHVMYDLKGLPVTTARAYAWACLKDKQTGKKLIVTCTHFIAGSGNDYELHRERCAELLVEAASTLMKKYGADGVVMAGDYNCNRTSKAYEIMATGLNSAREAAPVRVNMEYKTSCSVGNPPAKEENKAIDHVFYSKTGVVAKHFEAMISPLTYEYSDHVPVVFDFVLD